MTNVPVVFGLYGKEPLVERLCNSEPYEIGKVTIHTFPDKETLITIDSDVKDRSVIFIASLDNPNDKILPLIFAAETARELGANQIGLVAPYLAYMRQDTQFHSGEGITSKYFAKLLSTYFDWFITIDPHLHRWHSLNDVFTIPTTLLHATQAIARWIKNHVPFPLLIGPDKESTQWVADIAKFSHAPFLIVEKTRRGDADVEATDPQIEQYPNHTPIIIDDIISTGATMIETINHLQSKKVQSIIGLGVHAIFADNAYEALMKTGVADIITCNTIDHISNKIDLDDLIIQSIKLRLASAG
jgi:ribose-phosphate pyrophosphokinase